MILYKKEIVEKKIFYKFICDKCKNEIEDVMEVQETYSIRFTGGYASIFGDSVNIECDLCQNCLYDIIKPYYRIEES